MKKIWYLKNPSDGRMKTIKLFVVEKASGYEVMLDMSSFCEELSSRGGQQETALIFEKEGKLTRVQLLPDQKRAVLDKGKCYLKEEQFRELARKDALSELCVIRDGEEWMSRRFPQDALEALADSKTGTTTSVRDEEAEMTAAVRGGEPEEAEETAAVRGKETEMTAAVRGREPEETAEEELLAEAEGRRRIVSLSVLEEEMIFRSYLNNSFLLHGYYNYGHVVVDETKEKLRLGVPGNYYEREQIVAGMFGFPDFEAAKEQERIEVGTFGYYYTSG